MHVVHNGVYGRREQIIVLACPGLSLRLGYQSPVANKKLKIEQIFIILVCH